MSDLTVYDVAVLGGGPGGYVAALRAAARGASTCLIESGRVGGTCLNVGCIPTKAMLHASELFWSMRTCGEMGIISQPPQLDATAFFARVNRVVSTLGKGVEYLLKARKVDVIRGRGVLKSADTITVQTALGAQDIKARSIILATGSGPVRPAFLPWGSPCIMTTDEAVAATSLPASVIIVGGGVIGCEFATIYSELGIATTMVEVLPRLIANLDEDIAKIVTASLKKRGVKIITGASVASAVVQDGGSGSLVKAELSNGQSIEASHLLAAVGRQPNTSGIGLEALAVTMDGKVICVDDRCRTSVPNVYAIGDVAEARQYAHLASRMGTVAADNAAGLDNSDDRTVIPVGMYTHPEVATVGLSEQQARLQVPDVRVVDFPQMAIGLARAHGQTEGMVKVIASGDGKVLGGAIVGPHATDNIHLIAAAIRRGLCVSDLAEPIHAHPTFAEGVAEAAELWLGLGVHVPG